MLTARLRIVPAARLPFCRPDHQGEGAPLFPNIPPYHTLTRSLHTQIRFLEKADATSLIPPQQLQKIFGGSVNLEYNHAEYFPALTKLCMERKAANLERWRKYGGGKCGLDEAVIRGARVPGEEGSGDRDVASSEADVDARGAADVEPPTEQLAATSIAGTGSVEDGGDDAAASSTAHSSSASDATVAVPPAALATTPGVETDKFVDAPVAPQAAVEKAVPSVA